MPIGHKWVIICSFVVVLVDGWKSVYCRDFQGKESSGYNVPGSFPGGIFILIVQIIQQQCKSFNEAHHSA